jgi:hypothetical protein
LIELQCDDLRDEKLVDRKGRLAKMLTKGREAIIYNEHLEHDGATVFEHACRMGLEGIVSKRLDAPYRRKRGSSWPISGRSWQRLVNANARKPSSVRSPFAGLKFIPKGSHELKGCPGHLGTLCCVCMTRIPISRTRT